MNTIKFKSIFTLFLLLISTVVFSQTSSEYSTYDDAFEAFKKSSKMKGFEAVENKYKACKNLSAATIRNIDEGMNEFTGRMEVHITWDYKYVGCYIGYHKYNGSALVKASISKTPSGKYKISEKGVEVLSWDNEQ